ncbi:MAG: PepSY domain-containing protein [Alphaproteobacteria bacterium]|nr:PepSY domain-containing protein [Alphaproteobacteria bacterium]
MALPDPSSFSVRHTLRTIHLWIGVALCIPLGMLGITGAILVFDDELEALFVPAPPRTPAVGEAKPIAEIIAAARKAAPQGLNPSFYRAPEKAGDLAVVRLAPGGRGGAPGAGGLQLRIDPVSLEVVERKDPMATTMRWIFRLHANLLLSGRDGREVIGWLGVAMLALGCSGLVIWWPRPAQWRSAFGIRRGAKGIVLLRDLHAMTGIWNLLVFLVVSFSGVYLAFPQSLGDATRALFGGRDLRASAQTMKVEPVRGQRQMDVDAAVALARASSLDAKLMSIFLPMRPDQPMRIGLVRGAADGAPFITVFVDPWKSAVIETRDPRDFNTGESIAAWQHALHAGHGLGWVWKLLVFISGIAVTLFAITGTWMWLAKRRNRRRAVPAAQPGLAE